MTIVEFRTDYDLIKTEYYMTDLWKQDVRDWYNSSVLHHVIIISG